MAWSFRLLGMAVAGMTFVTAGFVLPATGGSDVKISRPAAATGIASRRDLTNGPPVTQSGLSVRQGGGREKPVPSVQPQRRLSEPGRRNVENAPQRAERKSSEIEGSKPLSRGKSARRAHRHSREGKSLRPQVTITPKPDLSYHGMLEQPQRYTPQYQQGKGSAPNPNAGIILHDHFQELDKNRDGSLDPFERALGRLDIDRDLTDRQWQ